MRIGTLLLGLLLGSAPLAAGAAWTLPHYTAELNPVLPGPPQQFGWQFRMQEGTSTVPTVDGATVFLASNDNSV